MRIAISTYMAKGSYVYLGNRVAEVLKKKGHDVRVITNYYSPLFKDNERFDLHIHYTTLNLLPRYKSVDWLKAEQKVVLADSPLVFYPILQLPEIEKTTNSKIFTTSMYDYERLKMFHVGRFTPHFVPTPSPPQKEAKRDIDFVTVGVNEKDQCDRKGHYWNYFLEIAGFNVKRVCHNFCPPATQAQVGEISDADLFRLYTQTKYFLAMSHAETPYLPLIESHALGTPSVYLNATEPSLYAIGVDVAPTYATAKCRNMIEFYDVDVRSFWSGIALARDIYNDHQDIYDWLSRIALEQSHLFTNEKNLDKILRGEETDFEDFLEKVTENKRLAQQKIEEVLTTEF